MRLCRYPVMDPNRARLLNPLQLAYIGDTVWDLVIRSDLLYRGRNLQHMHREAVASVNAHAQAQAAAKMLPLLTNEETDLFRRGRNAHARHPVPKNQSPEDYAAATGFEAVIGWLYLCGREERILEIEDLIREDKENA